MDNIRITVYAGIMAICATAILTGGLGIMTARYKSCCSIGLFSFFSFTLSILFVGLGIIIFIVTIASG